MSRKVISVLKVKGYSCANCTKESVPSNTQSTQDDMHDLNIIEDPEKNIEASDIVIDKYDNKLSVNACKTNLYAAWYKIIIN